MHESPSPATAERNQRRKLAYFPPVWPLLLGILLIVLIVWLAH
jgi:hypothetical protein